MQHLVIDNDYCISWNVGRTKINLVTLSSLYFLFIINRITFKINTKYYLELLLPETMKLLGSIKSKITKDKIGKNVRHLEITEVILVHCNIVNNVHLQDSIVLYTFVPDKTFGQLLDILSKNFIFLKTFRSEFSYFEVWFTGQNY